MKVQPINNIQPKTSFKANFSKQDVKHFLTEINGLERDAIPQLYTLLNFIKKQPGKSAKINSIGGWYQISIDGQSLNDKHRYINAFYALYDSIVINQRSLKYNNKLKRLSEDSFEIKYCKNANKTKEDIENLF